MTPSLDQHPRSLPVFFITEMWERYGFYVIQSLLALYLALHFHWGDNDVYNLVSSFTAITYLSPVIGGFIADRLIGQKRAVLVGAVVLLLSYLALTLATNNHIMLLALAGVAVGTGLLKPNISSLLGNEYPLHSSKREQGFTIFYMGITSGIILSATLPSYLKAQFGWSAAFLSAAVGMIISFSVFAYGVKRCRIQDFYPKKQTLKEALLACLLMILTWGLGFYILKLPHFADLAFGLVVLASFSYLLLCIYSEAPEQARHTLIIAFLCIISAMFWAFYFQMFLSLTLMLVRIVQPSFLGINFPPPYYIALQCVGMLIFGFFLTRVISFKKPLQSAISTANKFVIAMCCTTLSYAFIVFACSFYPGNLYVSPLLFIPVYLLLSIAELLLSPVGLSAITILADKRKVSTMMGIFFVSLGVGAFFAGKLAKKASIYDISVPLSTLKTSYAASFYYMFLILVACTLGAILLNGCIRWLLKKDLQHAVS